MSRKCDSCGKPLTLVQHADPKGEQFEDALVIQFVGGYGMFIDVMSREEHDSLRFVLCQECADRLVADNPFIAKVFTHDRWTA